MMEGFGVHTFRLVNAQGKSRFVKFHWKPLLGVHSVAWDEAQKISGKDPDFHRRDLWEAIESGNFPEYELGLQIVEEKDEFAFGFDLLDPTKIIPEELVPVQRVGKLTLNRNPDNFFAETEQVAFHIGHVVPGIDFTNDPLLQGRLFSYTDTQLIRLGGPNFHEIPINRPVAAGPQQPARRLHAPDDQPRPRQLPAELARRRLPDPGGARRPAATSRYPERGRRREGARARRELLRPLQPGAHVLPEPVGARAAAHHQGAAVRARQGRDAGDPRAHGRPPGADRRGAGRQRSRRASASTVPAKIDGAAEPERPGRRRPEGAPAPRSSPIASASRRR